MFAGVDHKIVKIRLSIRHKIRAGGERFDGGLMGTLKFGDRERTRVIDAIEKLKNIKLQQIGNYKKFLKDSDGAYYCIVGGTADWHGIPKEVMDYAKKDCSNFYLAVARLLKTRIELYMGPFKPLVDSKGSLTENQRGDFQFDLTIPTDNKLPIRQVPAAKLYKVYEFAYDVEHARDTDRKIKHYLKSLSPEQLSRLLKELEIKVDV